MKLNVELVTFKLWLFFKRKKRINGDKVSFVSVIFHFFKKKPVTSEANTLLLYDLILT